MPSPALTTAFQVALFGVSDWHNRPGHRRLPIEDHPIPAAFGGWQTVKSVRSIGQTLGQNSGRFNN